MRLKIYLKNSGITYRDMRAGLLAMFGGSPSISTLQSVVLGLSEPKLELALMISRWTQGEVRPHDLLVEGKRNYTESGTSIYDAEPYTYKPKQREESDGKTIRERLADPSDEVHEISDEDLQAAADMFDSLM